MTDADKAEIASAFADPRMKRILSKLRERNQHWRAVAKDLDGWIAWARKNVWGDLS